MNPCVEWQGCRSHGYGVTRRRGATTRLAHRLVMADIHGPEAIEGKVVMHLCDNPACINPEHLQIATQADNLADALAKGRRSIPDPRHPQKLTPANVLAIRASMDSGPVLGRRYSVSHQVIYDIRARRIWKHVQ